MVGVALVPEANLEKLEPMHLGFLVVMCWDIFCIEGDDIDTDYFHALQSNRQYTVYGDLLKNGKCVRVEILLSN